MIQGLEQDDFCHELSFPCNGIATDPWPVAICRRYKYNL